MQRTPSPRHLRRAVIGAAAAAVVAAVALPVTAQDAPAPTPDAAGEESFDLGQLRAAAMAARGAGIGNTDDLPDMDKVVEGLKKVENGEGALFEVYYAADPAAKNPSEIYGVIPSSLIGDDLLLATSISSGPQAGYQWSDYLVRMERRGDNLVLMVPDLRFKGEGPVKESVERTYTPRILVTLPIRAKSSSGGLVVDLSPLTVGGAVGGVGAGRKDLSRHPKVKVFPDNVLVEAEVVSGNRGPATTQGMAYSFRRLPSRSNPRDRFTPRPADERVGYFLTVSQDWGKPADARETLDRYINKWRVEKLDPNLEMSPPQEPIVFYIEKTVPIRWRRYVQEGIDEWNKAFEKIGIVGAIQVRQQTDTQYADIDPEDARYNFIRWIVTGRAFAMGPSRPDPRTGQILDADIIFDDSMLRYFQGDLELLGPASIARDLGPEAVARWKTHPGLRPMGVEDDQVNRLLAEAADRAGMFSPGASNFGTDQVSGDRTADARQFIRELAGEAGVATPTADRISADADLCNYAVGTRQHLAVAHLLHAAALSPAFHTPTTRPAAGDSTAEEVADVIEEATDVVEAAEEAVSEETAVVKKLPLPERYLGLILKEVVAHEVGHTLGLRHNFKASAMLSMDEIKERRDRGGEPLVSSVMDYNPVLLFAGDDPEKVAEVIPSVIGPYDDWAIEYGYSILPRRGGQQVLEQIADKHGTKELAYATDEDVRGLSSPDPLANRYDMGDDPIAWAKTRVELADELMETVEQWAVRDDEPNEFLRSAYVSLFYEKIGGMFYVARMVGGQRFSRARFDDTVTTGDAPGLTPLSAEEQRSAIAYLSDTVLSDGFFETDQELLNKLVPSRSQSLRGFPSSRIDFPIHETILNAQNRVLGPLVDPTVLQRVYDAQVKAAPGDEKFTAAELISTVADAIWGDLAPDEQYTDGEPMLSTIRRNLQTQHLNYLVGLVDSEPGRLMSADLRNLVRYQLRTLSEEIGTALEGKAKLDMASAAHLTESKSRIDRVLEAPHSTASAGGGGGDIILILGQQPQVPAAE